MAWRHGARLTFGMCGRWLLYVAGGGALAPVLAPVLCDAGESLTQRTGKRSCGAVAGTWGLGVVRLGGAALVVVVVVVVVPAVVSPSRMEQWGFKFPGGQNYRP